MTSSITTAPIDPGAVLAAVGSPADGAALLFLGTVRDHNDGRAVTGIHYDAYAAMAEDVLARVVEEAAARADTDRIAVVHRLGELRVGEVSVAIAVSSPHREEAFATARFIIEEIKLRLPVWKQERYQSGGARWLDGATPPAAASS
jgi:molybdopterin synthase catalytic subunit